MIVEDIGWVVIRKETRIGVPYANAGVSYSVGGIPPTAEWIKTTYVPTLREARKVAQALLLAYPQETCAKCGAPFEPVRPGKTQPTCDCR